MLMREVKKVKLPSLRVSEHTVLNDSRTELYRRLRGVARLYVNASEFTLGNYSICSLFLL